MEDRHPGRPARSRTVRRTRPQTGDITFRDCRQTSSSFSHCFQQLLDAY